MLSFISYRFKAMAVICHWIVWQQKPIYKPFPFIHLLYVYHYSKECCFPDVYHNCNLLKWLFLFALFSHFCVMISLMLFLLKLLKGKFCAVLWKKIVIDWIFLLQETASKTVKYISKLKRFFKLFLEFFTKEKGNIFHLDFTLVSFKNIHRFH